MIATLDRGRTFLKNQTSKAVQRWLDLIATTYGLESQIVYRNGHGILWDPGHRCAWHASRFSLQVTISPTQY
jgi:hypothetical protein